MTILRLPALSMIALALCAGCVGCGNPRQDAPTPSSRSAGSRPDSHNINSNSVFGSSTVTVTANVCAGRTTLQQGTASIDDSCFTGDTNVVLCTNVSALNPVRCDPHPHSLEVFGVGNDTISYARVK